MAKEIIEVPALSEAVRATGAPLSPVVRAGGLVFVSGLPPLDLVAGGFVDGGIAEQTEACMRCLKAALTAAGTDLASVVKVTIYASNSAHFDRINEVYARWFVRDFPARTFVTVGSWPLPFDIEIECIAIA